MPSLVHVMQKVLMYLASTQPYKGCLASKSRGVGGVRHPSSNLRSASDGTGEYAEPAAREAGKRPALILCTPKLQIADGPRAIERTASLPGLQPVFLFCYAVDCKSGMALCWRGNTMAGYDPVHVMWCDYAHSAVQQIVGSEAHEMLDLTPWWYEKSAIASHADTRVDLDDQCPAERTTMPPMPIRAPWVSQRSSCCAGCHHHPPYEWHTPRRDGLKRGHRLTPVPETRIAMPVMRPSSRGCQESGPAVTWSQCSPQVAVCSRTCSNEDDSNYSSTSS